MRNSAEKAAYIKIVMENFQERQIPRDDKWRDISNIHREESACKVLQEKKCKTFDTKRNGRNGHRDTEDK